MGLILPDFSGLPHTLFEIADFLIGMVISDKLERMELITNIITGGLILYHTEI